MLITLAAIGYSPRSADTAGGKGTLCKPPGGECMATRHTRISGNKNWIALDAGGTMTDAVVVDTQGSFLVAQPNLRPALR